MEYGEYSWDWGRFLSYIELILVLSFFNLGVFGVFFYLLSGIGRVGGSEKRLGFGLGL